MAHLVLANDFRFGNGNGTYYSATGGSGDAHLQRYRPFAEEITVAARFSLQITAATGTEMRTPALRIVDAWRSSRHDLEHLIRLSDLVIVRIPSLSGLRIARIAARQGKPYLAEVVGSAWDALWNHSWKGKLLAPFAEAATRRAVRQASRTVYVTESYLQSEYPTMGVSAGISDVECSPVEDHTLDARIGRLRSASGSRMILGTCAAVDVRYKGQQDVIRALGLLQQRGCIDFEYQLVGDGDSSYLARVAERCGVSDRVKFRGPLPHNEVFEWLDGIDVYVQPSRTEGLPRSVVEAMSRGVPCVGSSAGGIPELLPRDRVVDVSTDMSAALAAMLEALGREDLVNDVYRNHRRSLQYERNVIAGRRQQFMEAYVEEVMESSPVLLNERRNHR